MAISFAANAAYGYAGKQFIARIVGRDRKFTFSREFIGRKGGKRGDVSEATVDEPGLYETRDIDNKGRSDDSYTVYDGERSVIVSVERGMEIARAIESGTADYRAIVTAEKIREHETRLAESEGKDPEGTVTLRRPVGNLAAGVPVKRSDLIAERRSLIAELRSETKADDKTDRVARVKALMVELGVTIADLG